MKNILPPRTGIAGFAGSANNLIHSSLTKKKRGKVFFERQFIAADSSEASDGTKELLLGQDIGKKNKVLHQTFCRDYMTE